LKGEGGNFFHKNSPLKKYFAGPRFFGIVELPEPKHRLFREESHESRIFKNKRPLPRQAGRRGNFKRWAGSRFFS
jgi:hypothetical protein